MPGTAADFAKLREAWRVAGSRAAEGSLFDFSGLVRSLTLGETPAWHLDDEVAPALYWDRLVELALEHLGGVPGRDDVFVANRLTAAAVAAMQALVEPGTRVAGVSPSYTHPAVIRAVRLAGGGFDEGRELDGAGLAVVTRLAVTYEALSLEELETACGAGVPVFLDDAGGARVGPAVLGQPRALELGVESAATGLDKYGTAGPRLGLLAGRADLEGAAILAECVLRAGLGEPPVVPLEATAALAMVLLRDHSVLTVHFAAVPPGTAALLLKFVPPETLARFGGAEAFARAVDVSLDEVARLLGRESELRALLGVRQEAVRTS